MSSINSNWYHSILIGAIMLLFIGAGTLFIAPTVAETAGTQASESTANLTISITDSSNGQDSENVSITIAQDTEQPDRPEGLPSEISTDQYNAIDTNDDGSITLGELVSANLERIENSGSITDSNGNSITVSLGDLVRLNVWRVNN